MSKKEVCISCFCEKEGAVCGRCGYAESENRKSSLLPARTLLEGRYLTGEVIGMDSASADYKALDTEKKMIVEIQEYFPRDTVSRKTDSTELATNFLEQSYAYDRIVEEIKIDAEKAEKFSNEENLLRVLGSFKCNNTVYVVKEYVEGMYLSDFMKANGECLDSETMISFMLPVLNGLSVLHDAGMFHGAVSSQNIILTVNNQIKISDYGFFKKILPCMEDDITVRFDPGYAPPENHRVNSCKGAFSDVYSVAAVIYELLTGKKPSDALNRMNGEKLVAPKELKPEIPDCVNNAVMKALDMNPDERFANASDFKSCLTGEKDISEFSGKSQGARKHTDNLFRKLKRKLSIN